MLGQIGLHTNPKIQCKPGIVAVVTQQPSANQQERLHTPVWVEMQQGVANNKISMTLGFKPGNKFAMVRKPCPLALHPPPPGNPLTGSHSRGPSGANVPFVVVRLSSTRMAVYFPSLDPARLRWQHAGSYNEGNK